MQNGASAAAQGMRTHTLGGRKFLLAPLVFDDFVTAREEAAKHAKRSIIQTYNDNMDLLPENMREHAMEKAFAQAALVNADNLPPHKVWTTKTDANGKNVLNTGERFFHTETNQWIEKGKPLPVEVQVDFATWWMAQTVAGNILGMWLSIRRVPGQESVTLDEVCALGQTDRTGLEQGANSVGELSETDRKSVV